MRKIFFSLFLLFLIVFNLLNIIDKVTTYTAMSQGGFIELNQRAVYFFNLYGLLPAIIVQLVVVIAGSTLLYFGINKLSEKVKYIHLYASIPFVFLIVTYSEAVINNIRWLI